MLPIMIAVSILPVGTKLDLRLTSEVTSNMHSGEAVKAELLAPVYAGGHPVLGSGTQLTGNVADVAPYRAATDQQPEQAASVRIQFNKILDKSGHSQPLYCVLESVDNARETVDDSGLIKGILSSETYAAQIDRGIAKLESRNQGLAQLLNGIKGAMLKDVDASIDYKPGTDLTVRLTRALEWSGASPDPNQVAAVTPADALLALVATEPVRTVAQSPPNPSDIVNLMFIGSESKIQDAFQKAGWFAA
ncbi:MAG: hypothetical protein JO108_14140, partial [Acidobacteriaceae bacterium]|nr:hypothetical protein [Acidobacteriaceae bacterium]